MTNTTRAASAEDRANSGIGEKPALGERETPEGWKLVPIEPDDAMQAAGAQAVRMDTTALNRIWTPNAVRLIAEPEIVGAGDLSFEEAAEIGRCKVPPAGWACSREKGHDDPCAASPADDSQAPKLCEYCGGNGDVHSIDGEWRGVCTECAAPLPRASDAELREAARQFHNLTQGDSSVIIRPPSAKKRDAIVAAGERLRAALRDAQPVADDTGASPIAPIAAMTLNSDAAPLNGIPATLRHGEGAIARCYYCGRYSLDPKTLSDRQPACECGKQCGWSGSFKKPGLDEKWSGASPATGAVESGEAT